MAYRWHATSMPLAYSMPLGMPISMPVGMPLHSLYKLFHFHFNPCNDFMFDSNSILIQILHGIFCFIKMHVFFQPQSWNAWTQKLIFSVRCCIFIYKIMDYITIFKTMKQERNLMEPIWHEFPFKIPVQRYMKAAVQSHSILKHICW